MPYLNIDPTVIATEDVFWEIFQGQLLRDWELENFLLKNQQVRVPRAQKLWLGASCVLPQRRTIYCMYWTSYNSSWAWVEKTHTHMHTTKTCTHWVQVQHSQSECNACQEFIVWYIEKEQWQQQLLLLLLQPSNMKNETSPDGRVADVSEHFCLQHSSRESQALIRTSK